MLILVELLTITQWVEVRGNFCWYWWNCWPSLNELRLEVIFIDIGGIVDRHSMSWGERWFCWYWWNCWPSLNVLRWEVIVVDIGGIVDHHSMSWSERCFLLILVELLTITQWIEVRGDFCLYWWNCWPSLNELNRGVIFVDIGGGIVDHHSMSWSERWFLLILVELLTITQWLEVRGYFCWYWWWNCWPSFNELKWGVIFVDIGVIIDITQWVDVRGDFCWYWWNCWPSLNELRREVIFVDIGGFVDRHPMSWGERWFLLILVKLLTITQCIEVRGDFCWYWWNCWPSLNELKWDMIVVDIGGMVDHHSMNLGERWFLLILVELLTITQWIEVRGDFCWYWWNCWPSLNEFRWEVIFVDIGGIVDHHSMSWSERWFLLILV